MYCEVQCGSSRAWLRAAMIVLSASSERVSPACSAMTYQPAPCMGSRAVGDQRNWSVVVQALDPDSRQQLETFFAHPTPGPTTGSVANRGAAPANPAIHPPATFVSSFKPCC